MQVPRKVTLEKPTLHVILDLRHKEKVKRIFSSQDKRITILLAGKNEDRRKEVAYLPQSEGRNDLCSTRGRYHGGRRPSSDDSLHNPTVIPPSALDKLSIMKRYHRRRTCSHTSPRRSPTMVTLDDTRFVECRWWNDGWAVKTVVT